jgi:hypothetical protein
MRQPEGKENNIECPSRLPREDIGDLVFNIGAAQSASIDSNNLRRAVHGYDSLGGVRQSLGPQSRSCREFENVLPADEVV